MNGNHTVAGIFDGPLTPNSANVTINGTGIMTMQPANLNGFALNNASDGSLALVTINVVIAGGSTAGICAEESGQLFLNGVNTYVGGTYLGYSGSSFSSGIWNFNNSASFGTGPIYFLNCLGGALVAEGSSAITLPNAVTMYQAANASLNIVGNPAGVTFSGPWTLTGGGGGTGAPTYATTTPLASYGSLSIGSGGAANNLVIISGVISGTNAFTKYGVGILALTGVNTLSSNMNVTAGTLLVNSPGSLASGCPVAVAAGAILGGNGTINGTVGVSAGGILAPGGVNNISTLTLASTLTLNGGLLLFDLNYPTIAGSTYDQLANTGSLVLNGANVIQLDSPSGTIAAGSYTLMTYASMSGSGTLTLPNGSTTMGNFTLTVGPTSVTLNVSASTASGALTWTGNVSGAWNTTDQNWVNGSTASTYSDGDGVTFDDTASANFTVSGSPVIPGSVTFNNSAKAYTVSAPIAGTGTMLFKLGSGTATLSGANTYAGLTTIVAGTLTIGNPGSLGSGTYAGAISDNGTFTYASSAPQTLSGIISGAGALTVNNGAANLTLSGVNTFTGGTTISAGALTIAGVGSLGGGTYAGAIIDNGTFTYASSAPQTLSGVISGTGGLIVNNSAAVLTLTAKETYGGATTIQSGSLQLNLAGGPLPNGTTITFGGAGTVGTLDLDGRNQTVGGLAVASGATASSQLIHNSAAGNATLTFTGGTSSFSGSINQGPGAGIVGLTVTAGSLTLSGVNTYSGATAVNGGTLLVNSPGTLASGSAVTVAAGATLGGSGTINGTVSVSAGGILAPGGVNNISTLTLANTLTLNGGLLIFDLNDATIPGSTYDTIATGGTGALVLNGANYIQLDSPSGTIAAGTYTLMTYPSMSGSGTLTLPNGSMTMGNFTLTVGATSVTLSVSASTPGALTWTGNVSGAWNTTDQNWVDGSTVTTYSDGSSVTFDDTAVANFTISGSTVTPSSVIFNNSAKAYTVSAPIAGTGTPLDKFGSGTATLFGANTYSGLTTIGAGTLQVASADTPGTSGPLGSATAAGSIVLSGGTLQYVAANGAHDYSSRFSTAGSQAYKIDVNGQSVTFASPLASSGGTLALSSTTAGGKLTLTAANTYDGGTTLSGGTLSVGTIADTGASAIGNVGTLTLAGGTLSYIGAAAASTGRTVTGTGTIDVPSTAGGLTLSNVTGGATFTITKTNTGTLTLGGTADNSFLAMTISAGTVVLNKIPSDATHHALGVNSTVSSGGTLQLSGTGGDQIYSGVTVTVASGGVFDANGQSESLTSIGLNGAGISSGGALINSLASSSPTLTCTFPLAGNSSVGGAGNLTLAGVVSGAFALTKVGSGTVTLTKANTYSAGTTINSGGTLTLGSGGTLAAAGVIADNGTFNYNNPASATLSGIISGSGTLHVGGGSGCILTLTGVNTYSGITTVDNGSQLNITADNNLGTAPGSVVANQLTLNFGFLRGNSATSFSLNANRGITLGAGQSFGGVSLGASIQVAASATVTIPGIITGPSGFMSGGGTAAAGYGTNKLSGLNTYLGGTAISTGRLLLGANGALPYGTILIMAPDSAGGSFFDLGGFSQTIGPLSTTNVFSGTAGNGTPTIFLTGPLTVLETNINTTFGGNITGSGGSLTINGNGTLTLTNANTYTGNTTITAGTLAIGGSGSLGGGSYAGAIANSGVFTYNSSASETLLGVISGAGALNQAGSGTLTLTGTDTYTGATTVSAGTLLVTSPGSLASGSTVTVTGGTLGGTGTINGPTTVNAAGTLSTVDAAIGSLTFGSSLALSGTTKMEISKTAGTADKIVMSSGTVTLGGNLTVANLAGTLVKGDTFTLISGTMAGAFSSYTLPALATGLAWDHSQLAPGGAGTITVVCGGTLAANAGPNKNVCSGSGVVIGASPVATGGSGTYTYSWSPSTGLSAVNVANPTATPTSTTPYTVTVTDSVGCTAISSVTVGVNVAPAISTQPANTTVCSGSTATFSVTASGSGLSYSWANMNNGGWGSPWTLSGGGSTWLGTSTQNDQSNPSCNSFSGAEDINSPSGNALGMYGGILGDEVATRTFTALTVGQVVSIDFDNGNVDTGSKVGFSLQTSGPADVLQFYFLGGAPNYKYWDITLGEQDTGIAWGYTGVRVQFVLTSTTTYSLVVTPCGGTATTLTGTYSGTIAQVKLFNGNTAGGDSDNVYFNNFLIGGYTDNADNYSGSWAGQDKGNQPIVAGNGGSTYTTPALSANAQYQVTVYGCGGSVLSSAATATVNPLPTASVNSATICMGSSTTLTATTGASSPTYLWSPDGATTASITVSPASTTTYTVTVTDGTTTCHNSGSGTVTVNPLPTASVNSATICAGGSTTLTATTSASSPSYLWNDPSAAITASITLSPASTTTYTVTVTDGLTGCAKSGSGTVTVNPLPTVSVNSPTICAGGSAILTTTTGASTPSYLWSPGGQTTASITVSPVSTATYTVTMTDGTTGCANSGSGTVTVNPLPTVSVNSATVCAGGSATLTATTSALSPSYLWSPGGATTASITVSPVSTTTYTVTVTETTTLCANSGSGTVTVNSAPTADAGPAQTVCAGTPGGTAIGGSPTASGGTGPYTYIWAPATGLDDATVANPTAEIGSTTTYTVTVTDHNGCTANASVVLTVPPLPNIESTTVSGTDVTLVWDSLAGQTYRVQYTTDLTPVVSWTDLTPDVTATGVTTTYTDHAGAATPRFYRIFILCP
jgi:autotransporter-associated beta strand protein